MYPQAHSQPHLANRQGGEQLEQHVQYLFRFRCSLIRGSQALAKKIDSASAGRIKFFFLPQCKVRNKIPLNTNSIRTIVSDIHFLVPAVILLLGILLLVILS